MEIRGNEKEVDFFRMFEVFVCKVDSRVDFLLDRHILPSFMFRH